MEFNWDIPGLERTTIVASFAGAMAYLCTQDRMPLVRASGLVIAGAATAAFIAPGIIEWLADAHKVTMGLKAQYAFIFISGVAGIWTLNFIVAVGRAATEQASGFVTRLFDRIFGKERGGGQ